MGTNSDLAVVELTPDALKARFKKLCAEINGAHQNWAIRVHRSISWLKRANQFDDQQPEAKFLFLWISLNSLYSCWNRERNAPDGDGHARRIFLDKMCELDKGAVGEFLSRSRGLVKKLLSDPFLADVFWRDPVNPKAKGWATEDSNFVERNLKNGEIGKVLGQVMDRLFVLRGQLVHGASTGGSRLNRKPLNYGIRMLDIAVPLLIHVVIETGRNDDWPELCYPPV